MVGFDKNEWYIRTTFIVRMMYKETTRLTCSLFSKHIALILCGSILHWDNAICAKVGNPEAGSRVPNIDTQLQVVCVLVSDCKLVLSLHYHKLFLVYV